VLGYDVPLTVNALLFACQQVECSSLTGEADLVPASVDKKHDIPAEARNIVFMSSLAMNGEGRGIVIRTGKQLVLQGKVTMVAAPVHRNHLSRLARVMHVRESMLASMYPCVCVAVSCLLQVTKP
jgi:magnesium-transporting ATPase (P-type)